MPTTLKNGMFVTPPISNEYLTEGKKYKVKNVNKQPRPYNYSFDIKSDKNFDLKMCLFNECSHINNLNWKIVEL